MSFNSSTFRFPRVSWYRVAELVILRYPLTMFTHTLILALLGITALYYQNTNFLWGMVLAIGYLAFALTPWATFIHTRESGGNYFTFTDYSLYFLPMLVIVFLSLWVVGGPTSPFSTQNDLRYAAVKSLGVSSITPPIALAPGEAALIIPGVSTVTWWDSNPRIDFRPKAKTIDDKTIAGHISAQLRVNGGKGVYAQLQQQFANQDHYVTAIEFILQEQFGQIVSKSALSELPKEIVIEDAVGTQTNLEILHGRWVGLLVVTDIHRYFGE